MKAEMTFRDSPDRFVFVIDTVRDWIEEAKAHGCDMALECEHRKEGVAELRLRIVPRHMLKREVNLPPIAIVAEAPR